MYELPTNRGTHSGMSVSHLYDSDGVMSLPSLSQLSFMGWSPVTGQRRTAWLPDPTLTFPLPPLNRGGAGGGTGG